VTGRQLSRATLAGNTAARALHELGFDGLAAVCRAASQRFAPTARIGLDPRDGLPIVYSEARALRMDLPDAVCVVCDMQLCPVVDQVDLPDGDLAFLTPNLYPIVYPSADASAGSRGVHLVHWSTLRHEGGLAGADAATAAALLRQLARAEEFLLHGAGRDYPGLDDGHRGHVGIVKNRGRRVGGSVLHDHQQILLTALQPAEPPRSRGLGPVLLADTPESLVVDDIDGAATTLVPAFMRRPLHAFVVPAAPEVGWLHHLPPEVLDGVALALARLLAAADTLMTARHGEPAWNLACHTGPRTGPLFELRCFTQPLGGYEHLGLYLCEETPARSAAQLREATRGLSAGTAAGSRTAPGA